MLALDALLGRTLLISAHPDDEAVGCGVLLQRMREPAVAVLTDGAPADPFFWRAHGSREAYAVLRRFEIENSLSIARAGHTEFLDFADQELYRALPQAATELGRMIHRVRPEALLAPAYEGGHPDHDACAFLAAQLGRRHGLPVWEFPLYHRSSDGDMVRQHFLSGEADAIAVQPSEEELARKRRMIAAHASQAAMLQHFTSELEHFRPQPAYDFSAPPHPGITNYEAWQWPMSALDVCAAFNSYLERMNRPTLVS